MGCQRSLNYSYIERKWCFCNNLSVSHFNLSRGRSVAKYRSRVSHNQREKQRSSSWTVDCAREDATAVLRRDRTSSEQTRGESPWPSLSNGLTLLADQNRGTEQQRPIQESVCASRVQPFPSLAIPRAKTTRAPFVWQVQQGPADTQKTEEELSLRANKVICGIALVHCERDMMKDFVEMTTLIRNTLTVLCVFFRQLYAVCAIILPFGGKRSYSDYLYWSSNSASKRYISERSDVTVP